MNKKYIIIAGAIIVLLSLLLYKSYKSLEGQNEKYKDVNKMVESKTSTSTTKKRANINQLNEPPTSNEKPIFKFISNSNDLENEVDILQTNNEISYHTFDFNKNIISYKSKLKDGQWKTFDFKIKKSNINESLLGLKGMEFEIDNPHCYQIWVSTMGNIGYEFRNGQKLVFYGIREINK